MRERRRWRHMLRQSRIREGLRARRRNRKLALALTAGAMALQGTAVSAQYLDQMQQFVQLEFAEDERVHASKRSASDRLKEAMIEEEGVRYTVYRDVAGYPTVGVGHLVTPQDGLRVGDTIDEGRAIELQEEDLAIAEEGVRRLLGDLPVNQYEFDALVDLVFNVGVGNVSESRSPKLNAAIASCDYAAIAEELKYHAAGGSVAKGLVYRSERRTNIFLDGDYSNPRESLRQA